MPDLLEELYRQSGRGPASQPGSLLDDLKKQQRSYHGRGEQPEIPPDATPLPVPESVPQKGIAGGAVEAGPEGVAEPPIWVVSAAERGVLYDKPVERGHALASLAARPRDKLKAYQITHRSQQLENLDPGEEVGLTEREFRLGPGGSVEYYDPDTNRFALAYTPDMPLQSQIEGMAGEAMVLAPEIVAGGIAAVVAKHPAAVNIGAAGGAIIGEMSRIYLGMRYGLNEGMSPQDVASMAAVNVGLPALVGGAIGDKIVALSRFLYDTVAKQTLKRSAAIGYKEQIEEAAALEDIINEQIGREEFRLNLAQATNSDELLKAQEVIKRNPDFQMRFQEFTENQQSALLTFWGSINKGYRSRTRTKTELGEDVQSALDPGMERARQIEEYAVNRQRAELDTHLANAERSPFTEVRTSLTEAYEAEVRSFDEWTNEVTRQIDGLSAGESIIRNNQAYRVASSMTTRSRNAIFDFMRQRSRTLVGDEGAVAGDLETGLLGEGPSLQALNSVLNPEARWTFSQAWDAISALKEVARSLNKGLATETPAAADVNRVIAALETDLRVSTRESGLAEVYDQFITAYAQQMNRLKRGTVGQIMEREGGRYGRYKVVDEKVYDKIFFPGARSPIDDVYSVVHDNPAQMAAIRRSITDKYMTVIDPDGDGTFSAKAHQKFMRDNQYALSRFFNRGDRRFFSRAGGLQRALDAREAAGRRTLDRLNQVFEGRITNLKDPARVFEEVWDPSDPSKMGRLLSILRTGGPTGHGIHDDLIRGIQFHAKEYIASRIMGKRMGRIDRTLDRQKLNDFMYGKSGEAGESTLGHIDLLRVTFGEQYVRNLETLKSGLDLAAREIAQGNFSNTMFWKDTAKGLARAYVGLFTRAGRVITAADRMRGRAAERAMSRVILDPPKLKELLELRRLPVTHKKAARFLGSIGATAFVVGEEP